MEKDKEHKFFCEKCNFKCDYESLWLKHTETTLHKTGIKKKRSDIKEPYECKICNSYKTKNLYTFKQHTLNEHSDKEKRRNEFKYYCEYCDIGTFSEDIHLKHNKSEKHMNIINVLKLNNILK